MNQDLNNKSDFKIKRSYKLDNEYSNILNFYNNLPEFECCICFSEELKDICPLRCKHQICEKCIIECGYNKHDDCPLCRQPIDTLYNIDFRLCTQKPINLQKQNNPILNYLYINSINMSKFLQIYLELGKIAIFKSNEDDLYVFLLPKFQNKTIYKFKTIGLRSHIINMINKLKINQYNFWFNDVFTIFYLKNLNIDYYDFI